MVVLNWWKGKPSGSIACKRKQQPQFYWSCSSVVMNDATPHDVCFQMINLNSSIALHLVIWVGLVFDTWLSRFAARKKTQTSNLTFLTTISHQVNNFLETIVWEPCLVFYRRKKWTNIRRTSVSGDAWYLSDMAVMQEHMAKQVLNKPN